MTNTSHQSSIWKLVLLLLLGGLCSTLGQGKWPIAMAACIFPAAFLLFFRLAPRWLGIVGFVLIHAASWELAYAGMVKMPMVARWGLFAGLTFVLGLVFLVDRSIARRFQGFWTTLVFPAGWVAFEYVNGRFSPSGSWSSIAYSFTDVHSLLQVASVVGWTGITFLVGWVPSVALWIWNQRDRHPVAWKGPAVCAGVLLAAILWGNARLLNSPSSETVRVASIVGPSPFLDGQDFRNDVWAYTRGIDVPDDQVASAQNKIQETIEQHITLAERELQAGAKIVSFPEANPAITKREESIFVDAAQEMAERFQAYVGLGLFVFRPEGGLPAENKYTLVGPDGVAWDYLKATRVPGSTHVIGDGKLPLAETDLGRLSCAICFDMDFPVLLQQAGRQRVDMLLAPSNDWTEVRAIHARMAVMRAVEQGFVMVRPTKDGISLVTDTRGRTVALQDTDRAGEHVLVADVPLGGVRTLYSLTGDWFSWICTAFFLASCCLGFSKLRSS